MRLEHSFNIKPFTTFGVDANIATFIEVFILEDLHVCRKLGYLNGKDLL